METEREQLATALPGQRKELEAVQADVKVLRDVRHWLNQVLPSEQYRQTADPGRKPSVQESLKGRQERIRQEQAAKSQPPRTEKKQNGKQGEGILIMAVCHWKNYRIRQIWNMGAFMTGSWRDVFRLLFQERITG